MLRAGLIPDCVRTNTQDPLRQHLDLRIRAGEMSLDKVGERDAVLLESDRLLDLLWQNARRAANEDASPVTSGLFIQSLNELIDAYGSRDAALNRHVPQAVLILLFGTLVLTAILVGYNPGMAGHRASFAASTLLVLIVCLVFIVIGLDRPRQGLIEVWQDSLRDLGISRAFSNAGGS